MIYVKSALVGIVAILGGSILIALAMFSGGFYWEFRRCRSK